MNRFQSAIEALTDDELKEAIREFKAFDDDNVVPTGAFLKIHRELMALGQDTDETIVGVLRVGLHQRAARKWAKA
jgi:hypothetical protein